MTDDVVIFAASDNGGNPVFGGYNWPLRGNKHTVFEGGVRSNAFIWAPRGSPFLPDSARGARCVSERGERTRRAHASPCADAWVPRRERAVSTRAALFARRAETDRPADRLTEIPCRPPSRVVRFLDRAGTRLSLVARRAALSRDGSRGRRARRSRRRRYRGLVHLVDWLPMALGLAASHEKAEWVMQSTPCTPHEAETLPTQSPRAVQCSRVGARGGDHVAPARDNGNNQWGPRMTCLPLDGVNLWEVGRGDAAHTDRASIHHCVVTGGVDVGEAIARSRRDGGPDVNGTDGDADDEWAWAKDPEGMRREVLLDWQEWMLTYYGLGEVRRANSRLTRPSPSGRGWSVFFSFFSGLMTCSSFGTPRPADRAAS